MLLGYSSDVACKRSHLTLYVRLSVSFYIIAYIPE